MSTFHGRAGPRAIKLAVMSSRSRTHIEGVRRSCAALTLVLAIGPGCGDDAGSPSGEGSSSTGSDPGSSSDSAATESGSASTEETTAAEGSSSGEDTGSSEGADASSGETGTDAALQPADLLGDWASVQCEAYPDGNGGTSYLQRAFSFTEDTWRLDLDLFGDAECTVALFSVDIDGPYTLGELSDVVDGATEGQFGFESNVWTAHTQDLADVFTNAGCGSEPWEVGVAQDVTETGCIGVAHPIAECPAEYDIVDLDGDSLYFGERVTDMCSERGRPTALGPYPVVQPD